MLAPALLTGVGFSNKPASESPGNRLHFFVYDAYKHSNVHTPVRRDVAVFPDAEQAEGILIFRWDASLNFANRSHFSFLPPCLCVSLHCTLTACIPAFMTLFLHLVLALSSSPNLFCSTATPPPHTHTNTHTHRPDLVSPSQSAARLAFEQAIADELKRRSEVNLQPPPCTRALFIPPCQLWPGATCEWNRV
jgi:hypothetical protein